MSFSSRQYASLPVSAGAGAGAGAGFGIALGAAAAAGVGAARLGRSGSARWPPGAAERRWLRASGLAADGTPPPAPRW